MSRWSSQCVSTTDVVVANTVYVIAAINNLPPMCHVASPSHFVRVNHCTLVLDGPESPC